MLCYCRTDEAYCATNDAKKQNENVVMAKKANYGSKRAAEVLLKKRLKKYCLFRKKAKIFCLCDFCYNSNKGLFEKIDLQKKSFRL